MDTTIRLGQVDIELGDCVGDLGVLLESSLTMCQHVARVTSTCFFRLRLLRRLSPILDIDARKRLVCAFVLTRIDYCNSALAGFSDSTLAPLQRYFTTRRTVRPRLAYYVQFVRFDAWSRIRMRANLPSRCGRTTIDTSR